MSNLISYTDAEVIKNMKEVEAGNSASQMMALLSAIVQEKSDIDSMVSMLENQLWYERCILTVLGKNKATVSEIRQHRDQIATYTSDAVALLFQTSRLQQNQIIALGEAVNMLNGLLAVSNEQILNTQKSVLNLKNELINTLTNLADALNSKIESVDCFHLLITEIEQGKYTTDNPMIGLFSVLSQIDQRIADDPRKLEAISKALEIQKVLDQSEHTLVEYMQMVAVLPDTHTGIVYQEVACLDNNEFALLFSQVLEKYSFFSPMIKKAKKSKIIIDSICSTSDLECSVKYSSIELFQFFLELKKQYLYRINSIQNRVVQKATDDEEHAPDTIQAGNDTLANKVEDSKLSEEAEKLRIIDEFEKKIGKPINSMQSSLADLVFKDRMTTLPNENLFYCHLQNFIDENGHFVILDMDLDNYKQINDNFGYQLGDSVIKLISKRLETYFDGRFLVYRIGGDEYAVIIPHKCTENDILNLVKGLNEIIRKPVKCKIGSFSLTCSCGICGFPNDGDTPEEIVTAARTALYNAKIAGKNRPCIYSQHSMD